MGDGRHPGKGRRVSLTFHASNGATASGSGGAIGVAVTASAGDLAVGFLKWEGTSTTATASDGTTSMTAWSKGVISSGGSEPFMDAFYILSSVASGSVTYTFTPGANRTFRDVAVMTYTPSGTVTTDGTAASANGNSTAPNSGNITTTSSDGVAFGFYGDFGNTVGTEKINAIAAEHVQNAGTNLSEMWSKTYAAGFTGVAQATLGGSGLWLCGVIAFQNTASGGATPGGAFYMQYYRQTLVDA